MYSTENKQLMQDLLFELSKGNDKPFIEAMAEDIQWNWMGKGQWAKSFVGKSSVINELWANVKTTIKQPFKATVHRILVEINLYFLV